FGLTVPEARLLKAQGNYAPHEIYWHNAAIRRVLDSFRDSRFCPNNPGQHAWVYERLLAPREPYLHLADLASYLDVHERIAATYGDGRVQLAEGNEFGSTKGAGRAWLAKAILNVARSGKFSSDRTIREYASSIWSIGRSAQAEVRG